MKRIIRTEKNKDNPYVVLDKRIFEYGLSLRTLGVLTYLLSKPDDWTTNSKHLQNHFGVGRTMIGSALKELEKKGFLERIQTRQKDGTFCTTEYVLYEAPLKK